MQMAAKIKQSKSSLEITGGVNHEAVETKVYRNQDGGLETPAFSRVQQLGIFHSNT